MTFETVIGLEVHVELATQSKIFCSCTTRFGGEPNTQCCPICMGLPGTLPVLNRAVVEYSIRAGVALNCAITPVTVFDRKTYFYPDLPKAYQTSQLYLPICTDGVVNYEVDGQPHSARIREIHMEEDAGKLIHDPWTDTTLCDYNRGGVPLIEIVTQPDFTNAAQVAAFLAHLRTTLQYVEVSDCKMQEGSLRADINISVRPVGGPLGTRTEMKNMNSFKAIVRAIEYESARQIELISQGQVVQQQTRRWDDNKQASFAMRSKEDAQDYRYFPEPDLPPIRIDAAWVDAVRTSLPELPAAKYERYLREYGLPEYDAGILTGSIHLAKLFEQTAALCGHSKEASNWVMGDVLRCMKQAAQEPEDLRVSPQAIATLIDLVQQGQINRATAREVFEQVFHDGVEPLAYIQEHNLMANRDQDAIAATIGEVLQAHADSVQAFQAGKDKVFGFLVGQCMRALQGKADPGLVNSLLRERLGK